MIKISDREDNANSIIACYYHINQKLKYNASTSISYLGIGDKSFYTVCTSMQKKVSYYECLRNNVGHTSRNSVVVHDW
jgi:hypothetical protein